MAIEVAAEVEVRQPEYIGAAKPCCRLGNTGLGRRNHERSRIGKVKCRGQLIGKGVSLTAGVAG